MTAAFIITGPWGRVSRLETVLLVWLPAVASSYRLIERDFVASRRALLIAFIVVAAFLLRVVAAKYQALEVNAWDFSLSFDRPLEQTLHGNLLWSEDLRHSMLAVHCNWLLLAFVVPYAIVASPWWLLIGQAVAIACAALVLFHLLRALAADDFVAACGSLAFVLNRYTAKATQFVFVIDVFYPLALFLLMYAFVRRNTRLFAVALTMCVLIKEDAIVPLAGFALVAFAMKRWRSAVVVLVVAFAVFAVDYFIVIPGFAPWGGTAYAANWSSYGATPLSAIGGMLKSPLHLVTRSLIGARDVFLSLLFVPLAGFPWILGALPALLIYGGSDGDKVHFFVLHYSMPFLPALFASLPAGIERVSRHRRRVALAILLTSALFGTTYELHAPRAERHDIKPLLANRDVYVQGALLAHAGYSPRLHALHHNVPAHRNAYLVCETCDPYPFKRTELTALVRDLRAGYKETRRGGLSLFTSSSR